jgi:hypothetical protein
VQPAHRCVTNSHTTGTTVSGHVLIVASACPLIAPLPAHCGMTVLWITDELAERFKVTQRTVRRWKHEGRLDPSGSVLDSSSPRYGQIKVVPACTRSTALPPPRSHAPDGACGT